MELCQFCTDHCEADNSYGVYIDDVNRIYVYCSKCLNGSISVRFCIMGELYSFWYDNAKEQIEDIVRLFIPDEAYKICREIMKVLNSKVEAIRLGS